MLPCCQWIRDRDHQHPAPNLAWQIVHFRSTQAPALQPLARLFHGPAASPWELIQAHAHQQSHLEQQAAFPSYLSNRVHARQQLRRGNRTRQAPRCSRLTLAGARPPPGHPSRRRWLAAFPCYPWTQPPPHQRHKPEWWAALLLCRCRLARCSRDCSIAVRARSCLAPFSCSHRRDQRHHCVMWAPIHSHAAAVMLLPPPDHCSHAWQAAPRTSASTPAPTSLQSRGPFSRT
mmetsp:Transcript_99165/g.285206  ORF Transcript_99165/g.285206 Transcript_99165/m.285206 type:complete len:232 (-) Transcript_99165:934-1629(-)